MTQSLVAFSPGQGMISNKEFLEKIIALVNSKQLNLARKQSRGEVTYYYNIPCAFDIEVSSFYYNGEKRACMYIWQFGILNWVTYGRTWEEYKNAYNKAEPQIYFDALTDEVHRRCGIASNMNN